VRETLGEVGDALQRAVVLSTDRVQSVLEDAVLRGRMTRRDAEELATSLVSLGREQAQELRSALARSLGDTVAGAGEAVASAHGAVSAAAGKPRRARRPDASDAPASRAEGDADGLDDVEPAVPSRAAPGSLVPDDPAARSAKDLVDLSASLSTSELWTLRELEAAGKARATVLRAIDRKLNR
jgi:hypothetical protein